MVKQIILAVLLAALTSSSPESLGAAQFVTGVPSDPSAVGYLNLYSRNRDGDEFNREFSLGQALERLTRMRDFLRSFSRLTGEVRGKFTQAKLAAFGNTGPDLQTIGFHNIPLVVEGTILKQEYQLRQVHYELAQLKHDRGDISLQELNRTRTAYEEATKRFQIFWDTKRFTD